MPSSISVKFLGFWSSLDDNNKFVRALRAKFDVEVIAADSDRHPDLLFYTKGTTDHYRYDDSVKIYYTGENDVPNFNECDYALSFHRLDFGDRHMRYPLYQLFEDEYELAMHRECRPDKEAVGRPFCSFLMRSHTNNNPMRVKIAEAVESYRPIAYGGAWRNNVGGPVEEKIPFIAGYKFNLALENSVLPGYVTEKLIDPFAAGSVPIYWGAPDVAEDFNPESFINVADYATLDSFVADLRDIDANPARYLGLLHAPALIADRYADFDARLSDFLCSIASCLTKRVTPYGEMGFQYRRNARLMRVAQSGLKMRIIGALGRLGGRR